MSSLRDRNGEASSASPLHPCTAELCSPLADASHSENISCKIHGSGYPGFAKLATGRVRPTVDFRGAHCLPAVCGRSCVPFNRDAVLNSVRGSKVPPPAWTKRVYQLSEFGDCSRMEPQGCERDRWVKPRGRNKRERMSQNFRSWTFPKKEEFRFQHFSFSSIIPTLNEYPTSKLR
jgi:hypothetical protein